MRSNAFSSIIIDSSRDMVCRGGVCVRLRPTVFTIFRALWRRRGDVLSRDRIHFELYAHRLYCDRPANSDGCIQTMMCRLRRRLAPLGILILVNYAEGYFLAIAEPQERRMAA